MGLGKTLETLMLVLASQPPKGWAVQDLGKVLSVSDPVPVRSTLIVMPANLLQQWQDELSTHVKRGALKWRASSAVTPSRVCTRELEGLLALSQA